MRPRWALNSQLLEYELSLLLVTNILYFFAIHYVLSSVIFFLVIGENQSCFVNGILYPHGTRWKSVCNTCTCSQGVAVCTKVSLIPIVSCYFFTKN